LLYLYHFPFRLYLKGIGSALKKNDAFSNAVDSSAICLKIVRLLLKKIWFSISRVTQQNRNIQAEGKVNNVEMTSDHLASFSDDIISIPSSLLVLLGNASLH